MKYKLTVALLIIIVSTAAIKAGYWQPSAFDVIKWPDGTNFTDPSNKSIILRAIKDENNNQVINISSNTVVIDKSLTIAEGNVSSHLLNMSNPHQTTLALLKDVSIASPSNNQVLSYNASIGKWENKVGLDTRGATIIIAAYNSYDTSKADYLCDGIDDQVEIQNAINSLPSFGGKIILLDGDFNISSTITISKSNIMISGVGWSTKIILANGSSSDALNVKDGADNVAIENLQIDGNSIGVNQSTYPKAVNITGLDTDKSINCIIKNCFIHNSRGNSIYMKYAENCLIENNWLNNSDASTIYIYYVNNTIINKNHILNSGEHSILSWYSYHNSISNNQIIDAGHDGINLHYGGYNRVVGNDVYNAGVTATSADGIYLYFESRSKISDNIVVSSIVNGIRIDLSDYNVITDNICYNNNNYGVNINDTNCNDNYVVKNYLSGNTLGGLYDAGTGTIKSAGTTNDNVPIS